MLEGKQNIYSGPYIIWILWGGGTWGFDTKGKITGEKSQTKASLYGKENSCVNFMCCFSAPEQVTEGELSNMQVRSPPRHSHRFLGENEINKQWMVHSPRAPHPISCMAASNGLLGVSFYWHGTKQVPRSRWLDSPPQTRPVDKSKQNAPVELRDIVMLGWNEEVQWRGEGLRAQLHGAAAALRPSAHGAGESWKNFILQTQGIAGTVTSTALFGFFFFFKAWHQP